WNTRELLARALDSLRPEVERGRADVWVVDNASEDGSREMVAERYQWVRLLASEENLGFGRAVNLVARQTSSPWFASANADVALHPGALEALLVAGARDPQAGALAPRLVLPDGSTQHSVFAFPTIAYSFLLATATYRLSARLADRLAFVGHWDSDRERRVPWAIAAFLLFRREAFDAVGGFDERQWMYAEDLDIGWRLDRAGRPTRYVPDAHVDHESAASTVQAFGDELAPVWQRSTYGFLARRRGVAYARAVAALNLFGALWRWARMVLRRADPGLRGAHWRWVLVHARALRDGPRLRTLR
ncbi:MAG TPA: glycosyltransferase family 2 protein, partial [Solirubrobacteraceae bacterium]|nr:glycosyltransferase family 2 protein [Solirubrobacteraceae bacterium]